MNLCFVGDSLIEYYDWQSRFPQHTVANLGVSGETAAELLFRTPYLGLTDNRPDSVILMSGTNDILMGVDFLPSYEQIVITLRQTLPDTSLLLCGLLPMPLNWLSPGAIDQANTGIEALALQHKVGYLDGTRLISDATDRHHFFMDDGVHLSAYGYAVWAEAIEKQLHI